MPHDQAALLFTSRQIYSVHNAILADGGWVMREIKPVLKQSGTRRCTFTNGTGTHYPFMRNFQNKHCHFLVAAAWLGSRPEGMVIDHLNGNILNWSDDNLEYVTPAENNKRAKLLRVLRSIGREPKQMSREELQAVFAKYEFRNTILSPEGHDYFRG